MPKFPALRVLLRLVPKGKGNNIFPSKPRAPLRVRGFVRSIALSAGLQGSACCQHSATAQCGALSTAQHHCVAQRSTAEVGRSVF